MMVMMVMVMMMVMVLCSDDDDGGVGGCPLDTETPPQFYGFFKKS